MPRKIRRDTTEIDAKLRIVRTELRVLRQRMAGLEAEEASLVAMLEKETGIRQTLSVALEAKQKYQDAQDVGAALVGVPATKSLRVIQQVILRVETIDQIRGEAAKENVELNVFMDRTVAAYLDARRLPFNPKTGREWGEAVYPEPLPKSARDEGWAKPLSFWMDGDVHEAVSELKGLDALRPSAKRIIEAAILFRFETV